MPVKLKFSSYSLTLEEEALVAKVGYQRQLPYLARPDKNRNYSEGDVWEIWQHSIAAGAELAFARMCGLNDFVPHVNKFKSEKDVGNYEIRYSFQNRNLRLSKYDDELSVYFLLVDGLLRKFKRNPDNGWISEPYRALGWATGKQIKEQGNLTKWGSWELPARYLNQIDINDTPITELLEST